MSGLEILYFLKPDNEQELQRIILMVDNHEFLISKESDIRTN